MGALLWGQLDIRRMRDLVARQRYREEGKMNPNIRSGWFLLVAGGVLTISMLYAGFNSDWQAVGGPMVWVLFIGGSVLLVATGILLIRRTRQ